jgi:hypothetical protein
LTRDAIAFAQAAGRDEDATSVKLRRYRKSLTMLEQATPASGLVELLRFDVEVLETRPLSRACSRVPPDPKKRLPTRLEGFP